MEIIYCVDTDKYKNGKYDFSRDINFGEKGEQDIINILIKLGFTFIHKTEGCDSRYDLLMEFNEKLISYEIKTDIYPFDTGNIVVEFECRGKPSGIAVTEADYFTTYFPHLGEIWNIRTDELKKLIETKSFPIFFNSGDVESNTKLYKINKKRYQHLFKVHKLINNERKE